jgi:hypothetical protein
VAAAIPVEDDVDAREVATTLLDYYASAAMRSLLSDSVRRGLAPASVATEAFDVALAMVRARRRLLKGTP